MLVINFININNLLGDKYSTGTMVLCFELQYEG